MSLALSTHITKKEDRVFRGDTYLKVYFFAFVDEMQIEMSLKTNFFCFIKIICNYSRLSATLNLELLMICGYIVITLVK
jgi:hypothetical protein